MLPGQQVALWLLLLPQVHLQLPLLLEGRLLLLLRW